MIGGFVHTGFSSGTGDHHACALRHGAARPGGPGLGVTLDVEVREDPVEPLRQPPGGGAHVPHDRRHEEQSDDRRVDEDRRRHPDAHHLHGRLRVQDEAEEDRDHDRCGRGDHPGGLRHADGDRLTASPRRRYSSRIRDRRKTS